MAETDLGEFYGTSAGTQPSVSTWAGLAGALTSLALVAGVAVWGYQLVMRDANGVPVVRALKGPMRIEPADPGGERMAHQGLAVNAVAADGHAADVADKLVLAPTPPNLLAQDLPPAELTATPPAATSDAQSAPQPEPAVAKASDAHSATDLAVLAALQDSDVTEAAMIDAALSGTAQVLAASDKVPAAPAIPASIKGVKKSLVPPARPARMERLAARVEPQAAVPVKEIAPDTLVPGTRLVQLGAFPSPEIARSEWDKIASRFSAVMDGKARVIERATASGKTFYRLRVAGFTDLADSRRFCATLEADPSKPLCVPVAIR